MTNEYYHEVQKFRQKWIMALTIIPSVLMVVVFGYGFYNQIFMNKPFGNNPLPDYGLILTGIFAMIIAILVPVLLFSTYLDIRVLSDGIYFKYFPFILKYRKVNFMNISAIESKIYSPMKEYGGWGIRFNLKNKSMAYNVSGNKGVLIQLNDGKAIMFGSQKPDEFVSAVHQAMGR